MISSTIPRFVQPCGTQPPGMPRASIGTKWPRSGQTRSIRLWEAMRDFIGTIPQPSQPIACADDHALLSEDWKRNWRMLCRRTAGGIVEDGNSIDGLCG